MKLKKKKGFTLIELIVVIAIILLLVSIALPKYFKSTNNAKIAAHNLTVREIENAAMLYLMDNPTKTDITMENLKTYFNNGEIPKPNLPKGVNGYGVSEFTVNVNADGSVIVSPGIVEVGK